MVRILHEDTASCVKPSHDGKVTIMSSKREERRTERRMNRRIERRVRNTLHNMEDEMKEMIRRHIADTFDSIRTLPVATSPSIPASRAEHAIPSLPTASLTLATPNEMRSPPELERFSLATKRVIARSIVPATSTSTSAPTERTKELPLIMSDTVCYVCMPRLEMIIEDTYIISSVEKGQNQLKYVKNGRVECSVDLKYPVDGVISLGNKKLAIVSTSSAGATVTYVRAMPEQEAIEDKQAEESEEAVDEPKNEVVIDEASEESRSESKSSSQIHVQESTKYASVLSVSEGVEYSCTASGVYRTDVDSGELRLQQIKTRLPVGRLMTASSDSVYICTLTRLQRFSKEKMSGLSVWEHELKSVHVYILRCSNKCVAYSHMGGITIVDTLGEAHTYKTDEYVSDIIVHELSVLYITPTCVAVVPFPSLVVRRYKLNTRPDVGKEPYLKIHDNYLYYSTSFTIQRIGIGTLLI